MNRELGREKIKEVEKDTSPIQKNELQIKNALTVDRLNDVLKEDQRTLTQDLDPKLKDDLKTGEEFIKEYNNTSIELNKETDKAKDEAYELAMNDRNKENYFSKGDKGTALNHITELTTSKDVTFVEHGNMPNFAKENGLEFWKSADTHQYDLANGKTPKVFTDIKNFHFAKEMTDDQKIAVLKDYTAAHLEGHAYTAVIKNNEYGHSTAQIVFSVRKDDGNERSPEQYFANPKGTGTPNDNERWGKANVPKTMIEDWYSRVNTSIGKEQVRSSARSQNINQFDIPKLGKNETKEAYQKRVEKFVKKEIQKTSTYASRNKLEYTSESRRPSSAQKEINDLKAEIARLKSKPITSNFGVMNENRLPTFTKNDYMQVRSIAPDSLTPGRYKEYVNYRLSPLAVMKFDQTLHNRRIKRNHEMLQNGINPYQGKSLFGAKEGFKFNSQEDLMAYHRKVETTLPCLQHTIDINQYGTTPRPTQGQGFLDAYMKAQGKTQEKSTEKESPYYVEAKLVTEIKQELETEKFVEGIKQQIENDVLAERFKPGLASKIILEGTGAHVYKNDIDRKNEVDRRIDVEIEKEIDKRLPRKEFHQKFESYQKQLENNSMDIQTAINLEKEDITNSRIAISDKIQDIKAVQQDCSAILDKSATINLSDPSSRELSNIAAQVKDIKQKEAI